MNKLVARRSAHKLNTLRRKGENNIIKNRAKIDGNRARSVVDCNLLAYFSVLCSTIGSGRVSTSVSTSISTTDSVSSNLNKLERRYRFGFLGDIGPKISLIVVHYQTNSLSFSDCCGYYRHSNPLESIFTAFRAIRVRKGKGQISQLNDHTAANRELMGHFICILASTSAWPTHC